MRRLILFLMPLMIGFSCKEVKNNNKEKKNLVTEKITEDEALHLLHKWTNAYLTGNANPLHEVLDDSWVYSGSTNGQTTDKVATIEEFSNADYKFHDIEYQELDVRLFNDIAIVRGSERMVIVSKPDKDTTTLKLRFTDVYKKKNGKIKAIATHSSPIIEE
ncbi:nuclear transport factor 2 family protein [Croceitalea rosinachiae]|uniref:Nuclear transport factor 2 family protein n=1 Tax=Croceitalea rosinachiae TaxID=3075596 RepID=A0ABU3ADJ1_9FLAO|nr:nuclear transport factor 2 family protein [Croceitalea sp. F388]MDT0608254.1 nuclear transport factor 2 family protein [Croceitalea sp. F388]